MPFSFSTGALDRDSRARRGTMVTAHGVVQTPAFMPVGTRATVTGMTPKDLLQVRAQIILGNTYHLMLRPGPDLLRSKGGIHPFMRWSGPVLTDSGGFQIFSLSQDRVISEEGARFRSYLDGSPQLLSPERSIEVQEAINSDVMMVLDICLPSTSAGAEIKAAMERTHRWALRSLAARKSGNALFAIVQGGLDPALRLESARFLTAHPFDGFAIGGLAVGDTRGERAEVIALSAESLPADKPRYLMGVGTPPDILEAIGRGVDLFDCVLPTTMAWQGTAFTSRGRVKVSRTDYRLSDEPLDAACACETCTGYSRGYLFHLMKCKEPLAPRLLSFHNLHYYLELAREAREAIDRGEYAAFARTTLAAIDRHEHAEGSPGRRAAAPTGDKTSPESQPSAPTHYSVVATRSGAPSVRDDALGEVMHPLIGALEESVQLYAVQSRLRERLLEPLSAPLVVFDIGLGAGSNALAARRISESLPVEARRLHLISFENDTGALRLALLPEHAAQFGLSGEPGRAARSLLALQRHETQRTHWQLCAGDALAALEARSDALEAAGAQPASNALERCDVVFWDPFSPRSNPELWTVRAFTALRRSCSARTTLFTYSSSTTTRVALLLAGFAVGAGQPSGAQKESTCAALEVADLQRPLDARWLDRLSRSSAPLPQDAPANALDLIRALPQFAPRPAEPDMLAQ